jgi:hypothetical protein
MTRLHHLSSRHAGPNHTGRARAVPILACLAVLALPAAARAEVAGAVTSALRYDDNVFALPTGDTVPGLTRKDEVSANTADIDATLNPIGYKIDLEGNVDYEAYFKNTAYNNVGYSVQATSNPATDLRFSIGGSLTARQSLSSFASLGEPVRNAQNLVNLEPYLSYQLGGEIALVAAPVYDRSSNSSSLFDAYNYQRYGGSVGLGWHTPLGNRIDLTVGERWTKGLGDRFIDIGIAVIDQPTDLRDRSIDLKVNYQLTPVTSINVTASYIWRHDYTVLAHNFAAPFGEAGIKIEPATGAKIVASVGWRLETLDELFIDSVRTYFADITGSVKLSGRLRLLGRFDYYRRRFEADSVAIVDGYSLDVVDRVEHYYRGEVGLTYALTRRYALSANIAHESRSSTYYYSVFHENIAQLSLTYVFGTNTEKELNIATGTGN